MSNEAVPENVESKPEAQKPVKPAKPVKVKKEKKAEHNVRLPILLELTYTASTMILVFLALAVMITSMFAGATLFVTILRTGVAIFVVGGLLMLITSQISSGLLFAAKIEQEEDKKRIEERERQQEEEKKKQGTEPVFPAKNEDASMAEA